MMDVTAEEIKWMCEYAEGYEIGNDGDGEYLVTPEGDSIDFNNDYNAMIERDLIQMAIEGVNRTNGNMVIQQGSFGIDVVSFCDVPGLKNNDISDSAKLSALRYVKEQDKIVGESDG
jgi:hypothetical protein